MKGVQGLGALLLCALGLLSCTWLSGRSDDDSISTQAGAIKARPCSADSDCETGFCDVDACAEPDAAFLYGAQGCDEDYEPPGGGKEGVGCGAYVCRESRCRSCVSDDECTPGNPYGPPRCYEQAGRPGKSCGVMLEEDIDLEVDAPPPEPAGGSPSNGGTTTTSPSPPPPGGGGADGG